MKTVVEMALNSGDDEWKILVRQVIKHFPDEFERFAELVRADEREACAKVCDGLADMHAKMNQWSSHKTADTLAQAIRARSNT